MRSGGGSSSYLRVPFSLITRLPHELLRIFIPAMTALPTIHYPKGGVQAH